MTIEDHVKSIQSEIKAGKYTNEAQVSRGIVMRLLDSLGWPVYDMSIVFPEYPLENRRVDYALCHPASKPVAIVEVKAIGKLETAEMQLFEYAFIAGIQMAILTDGQEWHFYLPSGKGNIIERRFYKLDLIERDLSESSSRLTRYLGFSRIVGGEAIKSAREDHDSLSITREIAKSLPTAWNKLLEEQDSILLELLAEKVADICGYKPSLDVVGNYIQQLNEQGGQTLLAAQPMPTKKIDKPFTPPKAVFNSEIYYIYKGTKKNFSSKIDVLEDVLLEFYRKDSSFLQKFISRKHGNRRRYVAVTREELYPGRPDLAEHSRQLPNGWFMGTNYGKVNIYKIIDLACQVAGVDLGTELKVELGD